MINVIERNGRVVSEFQLMIEKEFGDPKRYILDFSEFIHIGKVGEGSEWPYEFGGLVEVATNELQDLRYSMGSPDPLTELADATCYQINMIGEDHVFSFLPDSRYVVLALTHRGRPVETERAEKYTGLLKAYFGYKR